MTSHLMYELNMFKSNKKYSNPLFVKQMTKKIQNCYFWCCKHNFFSFFVATNEL